MERKKNKPISVIVPVFNEENIVEHILNELVVFFKNTDIEHEIIVVNDGSTDKSKEIISSIQDIKLINHPYNKGYGAALKTGIKNSLYNKILIIDADNTYSVEYINDLIKYYNDYDMVVGARTGLNVNIPYTRKFAKWFITKLANYVVGSKIPDLNSGLRIFNKEAALINMNILPSGFSFTTTITIAMLSTDYFVKFTPIDYSHEKRVGKSKIRPIKHTLEFFLLVTRLMVYFKPLKIFIPPSVFILTIGLIRTIITVITRDKIHEFSLMTILAGLMLFLIGLLADMFVKSRNIFTVNFNHIGKNNDR